VAEATSLVSGTGSYDFFLPAVGDRLHELALEGDDLVGVEITAHGGCQAMSWWGPDLYVTAIRAE